MTVSDWTVRSVGFDARIRLPCRLLELDSIGLASLQD